MSTFNMNIDMGPEEAVDSINGYFEKVAQWFVGDMEPDIKLPMQVWVDTYNGVIKQRNLENTAWIVRAPISGMWGMPVGTVITLTGLPSSTPGFVTATGATLIRADYPLLWNFAANQSNNIVTDAVWHDEKRYGSYSYGDGETTFRVPLIVDFVRGYDHTSGKTMGQWVEDTFQGHWHEVYNTNTSAASWTADTEGSGPNRTQESTISNHYNNAKIVRNPSKGDNMDPPRFGFETAPKHVLLPRYIYTGEVW